LVNSSIKKILGDTKIGHVEMNYSQNNRSFNQQPTADGLWSPGTIQGIVDGQS
jgi:hypothetical protein